MNLNKKQKQKTIIGVSAILSLALVMGIGLEIWSLIWGKGSDGGIQEVTFFSNQDYYRDGGFNEGTYNGVSEYGKAAGMYVGIQTSENYYDFGAGTSYADPLMKIFQRADYVVTSGGNVGEIITVKKFQDKIIDNDDKSLILLDDTELFLANTSNDNFASVYYQSSDAGFLAGLAASVYSTYVYQENENVVKNIVGMWGGVDFPTIEFLSGFEQAVNWFNFTYFGVSPDADNNSTEDIYNKNTEKDNVVTITSGGTKKNSISNTTELTVIDYSKTLSDQEIKPKNPDNTTDYDTWYTGGFDIDENVGSGASADAKSLNMVTYGTNVMFPVAGGQTLIALGNIQKNKTTKIIGVDTSVEKSSSSEKDKILGSAVKQLADSAKYALWFEREFKPAYDVYSSNDGIEVNSSNDGIEVKKDINNLTVSEVNVFVNGGNMPNSSYNGNDDEAVGAYKFVASSTAGDVLNQNGWNDTNVTRDEVNFPDAEGTSFHGTYDNSGVAFTTPDNSLDTKVSILFGDKIETFDDLATEAFSQNDYIVTASMTFLSTIMANAGRHSDNNELDKAWTVTFKD